MSTDQLGTALRDLVQDVEGGVSPPCTDDLWAAGRRRRRAARVVPLLAAACVAAMAALVVWPVGTPRASVPAVQIDDDGAARLTAYPDVIAKPPTISTTTKPGAAAALVPGGGVEQRPYVVSPTGVVRRLDLPPTDFGFSDLAPSLSPDGRWVARGAVLTDLVRGVTVPSVEQQTRLDRDWMPPQESSWWSPDSTRAFVGAFDQGVPTASGVVVGVDGVTTEVPLVEGGLEAVFAGWLDDRTLFALLDLGPGATRLEVRTWSLGDAEWSAPGTVVRWREDVGNEPEVLRALLSPDGSRLLLTSSVTDPNTNAMSQTDAMMFDPLTGALLGMPTTDGALDPSLYSSNAALSWEGWGCRPAWRDGLPVQTDEVVQFSPPRFGGGDLVSVSSGYGDPCVSFAGNELRGTPVTNHVAVWQERVWTWGVPLLVLLLVGAGIGWAIRRRKYPRRPPRRLPMIITQPF